MEITAPVFQRPDYELESERNTGNVEVSTKGNPNAKSRNVFSKHGDDNEVDPATGENQGPSETPHLIFTESAKYEGEPISGEINLHRESARGPSEARQRRQYSVVMIDDTPHIPLYIHLRNAVYGSLIMLTTFPYWDMAFWSGWSYTWGSILFVIDSAWAWTPLQWPESEFDREAEFGVPLLFFFGALLYQLGATMAYLEAINDGSFGGPAMKRFLDGKDEEMKRFMDQKLHMFFGHVIPHHHSHDDDKEIEEEKHVDPEAGLQTWDKSRKLGSFYPESKGPASRRGGVDMGPTEQGEFHEYLTWRWWPTWHALTTYHIKDMGYVSCVIQLLGATLYAICGVIGLPGILSNFQPWQTLGGYWIPQAAASICFLTAGIMFTLITQEKWYRPLPHRIAWWIGVWATIGSMGFL
jgi:hypothetical protein